MSVKLMAVVWELDLPPGEKLVLLALADQANDDGVQCWPAVSTIARKSGQGERTVRRALADLEKQGHLTRQHRDGTSTQYHIHPCQNGSTAKLAPLPNTPETPAKLAPKPSRTTKLPKKGKPSLDTRGCKLPSNFEPMLTGECSQIVARWPPGRFDSELAQFRDHHTAKGTTSKDWQASLRTWVRNAEKWTPRDGRRQPANGLRGARPDAALDMWLQANADIEAERRDPSTDFGTRIALPPFGPS